MRILSTSILGAAFCFGFAHGLSAKVNLVEDGQPRAVVVTADTPSPTALFAAEELIGHIRKATGATLPQMTESELAASPSRRAASKIFVGETRQAVAQGIDSKKLRNDDFLLKSIGDDLYIIGRESPKKMPYGWLAEGAPSQAGTLFGVYDLLEEQMGVRWFWPGELGAHVPKRQSLEIDDIDRKGTFQLRDRRISYSLHVSMLRDRMERALAFGFLSEENARRYQGDLEIFMRRQRMGSSDVRPFAGHFFEGWWEKYGKEHPEWFMMREDGQRGPAPGQRTDRVAMCVSNPELHRYIAEERWDGKTPMKLGEVDARLSCVCPKCLEWDGEQPDIEQVPPTLREVYRPRVTSNRYARFWKSVYDLAAQRNPKARLATQLYINYASSPTEEIKLNPNIYGQFVPYGTSPGFFWPMTEAEHDWQKRQWKGWADTGFSMIWRTNHLHAHYVMPDGSTRQMGDFIKHAAEHGMKGVWLDSLFPHWATLGPMYYLHLRLIADPQREVEDVRKEYFSAFGPAAGLVEQYFDYWENYNTARPRSEEFALRTTVKKPYLEWYLKQIGEPYSIDKPEIREIDQDTVEVTYRVHGTPELRRPVGAHLRYPDAAYLPAEALLAKAMEAAKGDPDEAYAQRVKFLQDGLTHARLSADLWRDLDYDFGIANGAWGAVSADPEKRERTRAAFKKLLEFRHAHQDPYIADYVSTAYRENRIGGWQTLLNDAAKPVAPPERKKPSAGAKPDALEVLDATE